MSYMARTIGTRQCSPELAEDLLDALAEWRDRTDITMRATLELGLWIVMNLDAAQRQQCRDTLKDRYDVVPGWAEDIASKDYRPLFSIMRRDEADALLAEYEEYRRQIDDLASRTSRKRRQKSG